MVDLDIYVPLAVRQSPFLHDPIPMVVSTDNDTYSKHNHTEIELVTKICKAIWYEKHDLHLLQHDPPSRRPIVAISLQCWCYPPVELSGLGHAALGRHNKIYRRCLRQVTWANSTTGNPKEIKHTATMMSAIMPSSLLSYSDKKWHLYSHLPTYHPLKLLVL